MAEPRTHVSRRIRIGVVVAASALFMMAIMNLILVSEQAPLAHPGSHPAREWRAGGGSTGEQGRESWTFTIEPKGRSLVELDVEAPFVVSKTHVRGTAELSNRLGYYVDGREVAAEQRSFTVQPAGNESEPRSRTTSDRGAFGFDGDPLRLDVPEGADSFVLLMTWDWRYEAAPGTEASFRVRVGELKVEGMDTGGLPLCDGLSCARLLVIAGLAVQVLAFVWMAQAPGEDRRPPFMRRQGQVERDVRDFEVDEPDALPATKRYGDGWSARKRS